jgi:hypothetical protein
MPFNQEKVLEDVRRVLKREKFCLIVVAEGLVDADGNYLAADAATDAFGHAKLGRRRRRPRRDHRDRHSRALRSASRGPASSSARRRTLRVQDRRRRGLPGRPGGRSRRDRGRNRQDGHARPGRNRPLHLRDRPGPAGRDRERGQEAPARVDQRGRVSMNFQFLRYAQPLIQGEVVGAARQRRSELRPAGQGWRVDKSCRPTKSDFIRFWFMSRLR